jgi:hypothetical protein
MVDELLGLQNVATTSELGLLNFCCKTDSLDLMATECQEVRSQLGIRLNTIGIMREPALSGLRGVGAVGVDGDSEIYLVLFVPLAVTFSQDEHTPRFQALDELANSLHKDCYLRRTNISVQVVFENENV